MTPRNTQHKSTHRLADVPFPAAPQRPAQSSGQLEAIEHLKAGRLEEAAAQFERVIASAPDNWQSIHLLGLVAYKQGKLEEAAALVRQCLLINPNLAEAYSDLSVILKDIGDLDDALAACEKAIALKPGFHLAYNNLGNIFKAMRKLDDAADSYRRAIELAPNFAEAHANLGNVLTLQDKKEEALDSCLKAVELAPNHVEALVSFAYALRAVGELADAISICRRSLELRPDFGPGYSDLGCLLQEDRQYEEAIRAHKKAIELQPDYAEAHNNLGITYKELGRYAEALSAYRNAIELRPAYADAYSNMGVVLGLIGQNDDAIRAYRQAIELDPGALFAYINLAGTLSEKNEVADAIATYSKALTINPDHPNALLDHYHLRRRACDWDGIAAAEERILTSTYREGKRVASFPILNMPCGAEDHLISARVWAKGLPRPLSAPFVHRPMRSASAGGRLRVGYLSADFYAHATASLLAELIELHDPKRFEVFAYCFSPEDSSPIRRRLLSAFDHYVNISRTPYAEAAKRIHDDGIDILIDLKGYTTGARTEILTSRPAPIQINYLGYPGSMGADFIDYVIADDFILPMDQQPFFDEKIVHLPGCYQPNDSKRPIALNAPSRADCGLPEDGFVFCSFNNSYKITPEMFGVWMRLLQNVPGSVLWLLESNSLMRENLRRKAVSLGVDPGRLVFAPKMELSAHLARHRNADLFLDCSPVNAHTTASDALWAGLPVLTCAGETMVSRVCGSLLKSVGLSELITYSLDHYEGLALDLARNPDRLQRVRQELEQNRDHAPLFDTERYCRAYEAALEHMAELHEQGHEPRAFAVNEDDLETARRDEPAETGLKPFELLTLANPPVSEESAGDDVFAAFTRPTADETQPSFSPTLRFSSEPVTTAVSPALEPVTEAIARELAPEVEPAIERTPYTACPLCESADFSEFRTADCSDHPLYRPSMPSTLCWCRCSSCGHVFTDGYFTPEGSALAFPQPLPHKTVGNDVEAQRYVAARIVSQIAKLKPSGDWLDVQCGDASLLFTAEEWGYHPVGIDTRRDNTDMLKQLGYETYAGAMDELDMPERFSVISMADVLEQMPFPKKALNTARQLIQPGGILFCSTPNMASIVWRIMESTDSNGYWSEIEHYHNFTRERLYALLEASGFRPVFYNVSERYRACMDVIAMKD